MEKFLSIGEVVKIKGVTHRALRHYNDLGILIPAYTNADTGYRYYAKNQMIILDVILLCVALHIPLQNFKQYTSEKGIIDVKHLIDDAKDKALAMQKEIEQKLYFLHSVTEHFAEITQAKSQNGAHTRHIPERYFLTTPAPQNFGTHADYWTKLTNLYKTSLKKNYTLSINQGLCFFLQEGQAQVKYFMEIQKPKKIDTDILRIPPAEFLCEIFEDSCFFEALAKYQAHERYLAGNMFILNDILEENISHEVTPFEIQLML